MEPLINESDKITRWPKRPSEKEDAMLFLASKFIKRKEYSEGEVNDIIEAYHTFNDTPLLRRELISRKYLSRKDDGSIYWKL